MYGLWEPVDRREREEETRPGRVTGDQATSGTGEVEAIKLYARPRGIYFKEE